MPTRSQDVTTASVLARGTLAQVREAVVRLGRDAWLAPAGPGWVLVVPDRDGDRDADAADPFDLIGLGRGLTQRGVSQALVLGVVHDLGVAQLMSRSHETAYVGWRGEGSGRERASRAEPDAMTFCTRFGVPERAELVELLLEDISGRPEERLADLCRALAIPSTGLGVTADAIADERLHLPYLERQARRGLVERALGSQFSALPWTRRTWATRSVRLVLLVAGLSVFVYGWLLEQRWLDAVLTVGSLVAIVGTVAEMVADRRRSSLRDLRALRVLPAVPAPHAAIRLRRSLRSRGTRPLDDSVAQ